MDCETSHTNESSRLSRIVGDVVLGTTSFFVGATIGATWGSLSAVISDDDVVRDEFESRREDGAYRTSADAIMGRSYLAGRTFGQGVLVGALVYGIVTGKSPEGFLD